MWNHRDQAQPRNPHPPGGFWETTIFGNLIHRVDGIRLSAKIPVVGESVRALFKMAAKSHYMTLYAVIRLIGTLLRDKYGLISPILFDVKVLSILDTITRKSQLRALFKMAPICHYMTFWRHFKLPSGCRYIKSATANIWSSLKQHLMLALFTWQTLTAIYNIRLLVWVCVCV